jgi:hypothetical protein
MRTRDFPVQALRAEALFALAAIADADAWRENPEANARPSGQTAYFVVASRFSQQ